MRYCEISFSKEISNKYRFQVHGFLPDNASYLVRKMYHFYNILQHHIHPRECFHALPKGFKLYPFKWQNNNEIYHLIACSYVHLEGCNFDAYYVVFPALFCRSYVMTLRNLVLSQFVSKSPPFCRTQKRQRRLHLVASPRVAPRDRHLIWPVY